MRLIEYRANPAGRRCYVLGRRLHHGTAALLIAPVSYPLRRRAAGAAIIAACAFALAHDVRDFPFRDTDNH